MARSADAVWVRPEEHKIVGEVLGALRRQTGVTQQELADRLEKPQSFVSAYEAGQRRVDVLELLLIIDTLGGDPVTAFQDILAARRKTQKRPGR